MAVVKKQSHKKSKTDKTKSTTRPPVSKKFSQSLDLSLPERKTIPIKDMSVYTWLLYGERHIGKTTLAKNFDDPFFLFFEPGGKAKALKARFCPTWEHFLGYIELLEENPDYCKTVVIDPGGKCYDLCFDYVCKVMCISHPADESKGGKGWKAIEREFVKAHNRIFDAGFGMIACAHSVIREVKDRAGNTYNKLTVELSAQAFRYYCGTFDTTAYYTYDNNSNRILTLKGSADVEAGSRCDDMFSYTDGSEIIEISMGNDKTGKTGYKNLELAFNNKLVNPRKGGTKKISKLG